MKDWQEQEQLHFAASDGDLGRVQKLIREGADLDAFDELGMAPLHYAAKGEHLEVMRALLDAGCDVNAHDAARAGETPLGEVAQECSYEVAELLIKAGADPTIPGSMQLTALHRAVRRKKPEGKRVFALLANASRR